MIRQTEIPDVRSHRGDTRGVLSLKRCQNRPVAESGPFVADAGAVFFKRTFQDGASSGYQLPQKSRQPAMCLFLIIRVGYLLYR